MKHHLILFYGASSSAGKSTLSSQLHQALKQANVPTQWLYEDDVQHLDLFAPVMAYMRGEEYVDMPSACLAATTRLVWWQKVKTTFSYKIQVTGSNFLIIHLRIMRNCAIITLVKATSIKSLKLYRNSDGDNQEPHPLAKS